MRNPADPMYEYEHYLEEDRIERLNESEQHQERVVHGIWQRVQLVCLHERNLREIYVSDVSELQKHLQYLKSVSRPNVARVEQQELHRPIRSVGGLPYVLVESARWGSPVIIALQRVI